MNCEIVNTRYRILQRIANNIAKEEDEKIPFAGLPLDIVYSKLCALMDKHGGITVIVLDELDKLKGDTLYILSRINSDLEKSKVTIVGISNDLKFKDTLDQRVKSSLGETDMIFSPYNAEALQDILKQRAAIALKPEVLDIDVIPLCAALSAQEHGDARRALDILRVSAELAERNNALKITKHHVKMARNKIEKNRIKEIVCSLPVQIKIALFSILLADKQRKKMGNRAIYSGDVYNVYKQVCQRACINFLTQRSVANYISELDELGIINSSNVSKGRYGRFREINITCPSEDLIQIMQKDELFKEFSSSRMQNQERLM